MVVSARPGRQRHRLGWTLSNTYALNNQWFIATSLAPSAAVTGLAETFHNFPIKSHLDNKEFDSRSRRTQVYSLLISVGRNPNYRVTQYETIILGPLPEIDPKRHQMIAPGQNKTRKLFNYLYIHLMFVSINTRSTTPI